MSKQNDPTTSVSPQRAAIIEDLLKNRPSGPSENPAIYTETEVWDPARHQYVTKYESNKEHFGYDKRVLFNMGIRSIDDVRKLLRNYKFEGKYYLGSKKRTYTRQCNRLWARLSPAVKAVIDNGGSGVYRVVYKSVRSAYTLRETNVGFVYAIDYEESRNIARLMFGYLVKDPENIETVFARYGTTESLRSYNTKALEKIDGRLKDLRASVERTHKTKDKLNNMREAVINETLSLCNEDSSNPT